MQRLAQLFFKIMPQTCLLCHLPIASAARICRACLIELPYLPLACYQCASPLSLSQSNTPLCGKCIKSPPLFSRTIAALCYRAPITDWIYQLKFHHRLLYSIVLSDILLTKIKTCYVNKADLPQCIIPIPLHAKRLRQRGYNQALELAKPIANALQLPLIKHHYQRQRYTHPQSELSKKARHQNVKEAFYCDKQLPYQHVAIFDDVITTGSTVSALTACLKQNGIEKVDVWCVARTVLDD